jgi:hypothetical protein
MERILEYSNSLRGRRAPLDEDEWEACEPVTGGEVAGIGVTRPQKVRGEFTAWSAQLPF